MGFLREEIYRSPQIVYRPDYLKGAKRFPLLFRRLRAAFVLCWETLPSTTIKYAMKTYVAGTLALASMSSLFAVSANATTTIESVPFTITTSGNYILDGNLVLPKTSQTAITVSVSNVSLNRSFELSELSNNVVIQNGTITGFAS